MGRILAFDVGQKRTGIAHTDDLKLVASGWAALNTEKIIPEVKKYLEKYQVEKFVVGMPLDLLGRPTNGTQYAEEMVKKLKNKFPDIPVEEEDERFTSQKAKQTLIDSGIKKKKRQNKGLLDEVSATIILQYHLGNI